MFRLKSNSVVYPDIKGAVTEIINTENNSLYYEVNVYI